MSSVLRIVIIQVFRTLDTIQILMQKGKYATSVSENFWVEERYIGFHRNFSCSDCDAVTSYNRYRYVRMEMMYLNNACIFNEWSIRSWLCVVIGFVKIRDLDNVCIVGLSIHGLITTYYVCCIRAGGRIA